MGRRPQADGYRRLPAVAADRFDRAAFHRFLAKRFFLGALRLFVNKGVAAVVVTFVICRGGLAAEIAIDALVIDVIRSGNVFGIFVCCVGHIFGLKATSNVERKPPGANGNLLRRQAGATNGGANGEVMKMTRSPTKKEKTKTLRAFLVELAIYIVFVTVYFFLVLHFLADWLQDLYLHHLKLYAFMAIVLIIGQAVFLEAVTTWLLRFLRRRAV